MNEKSTKKGSYSIWSDDSWTVGADESWLVLCQQTILHFHHVVLGNSFSDRDDKWHFSVKSFEDGFGCTGWWYINDSGFSAGSWTSFRDLQTRKSEKLLKKLSTFTHRVEHRQVQMCFSTLARADTANHSRSIFNGLLRMESSLLSCESLANYFRVFRELKIHASGFVTWRVPHAELAQLKSICAYIKDCKKKCLKIKPKGKKKIVTALRGHRWLMSERVEKILSHMMHSD